MPIRQPTKIKPEHKSTKILREIKDPTNHRKAGLNDSTEPPIPLTESQSSIIPSILPTRQSNHITQSSLQYLLKSKTLQRYLCYL